MTEDGEVIARIGELVDEEHRLERASAGDGADEATEERLRQLEVALDQCWDLLRQRRARRSAGDDPDASALRAPEVVERYQQ
jgi:Protein of unknown function (DUF2630)